MNPDHLIELAGQIVQIGTGNPRQATVNRTVSTAYYAVFHALAAECVARTVGVPRSPRYWDIVTPVHRSLDHGAARRIFDRLAKDRAARSDLKSLTLIFIELQSARHAADYDPECRHSRRRALDLIGRGRAAIDIL